MTVGRLSDVLDFTAEQVRDAELPPDPFTQQRLLVSALALGAELTGLVQRIAAHQWRPDPRYAAHQRKVPPDPNQPGPGDPPDNPPPVDPKGLTP